MISVGVESELKKDTNSNSIPTPLQLNQLHSNSIHQLQKSTPTPTPTPVKKAATPELELPISESNWINNQSREKEGLNEKSK
jgi:hypothetical protein